MENKKNNVITVDPSLYERAYDEITRYFEVKTNAAFNITYPSDDSLIDREDYDYLANLIAPDLTVIRDDWLAHLATEWRAYGAMRLAYVLRHTKAVAQCVLFETIKGLRHKGDYSTLTILAEYATELDIPFGLYDKINRMIFDADHFSDDLTYDIDSPSLGSYYDRMKQYYAQLMSKTVEAQLQQDESNSSIEKDNGEIVVTDEYLRQKSIQALDDSLYAFEVYNRMMQVYGYIACYAEAADDFFGSVAQRLRVDRDAGQISGLMAQITALIRTYDAYCHYSDLLLWEDNNSMLDA